MTKGIQVMKQGGRTALLLMVMLAGMFAYAHAADLPASDPAGAHDQPLLPRLPDARIVAFDQTDDEEATLPEGRFVDFDFVKVRKLEGRVTRIAYVLPDGVPQSGWGHGTSTLTVINHYLDVLKGSGFAIDFACDGAEGCGGFSFGERLTEPMAQAHSGDQGNLIIDFLHPVGDDVRYVLASLDRPQGRLTVALAVMRHSARQPGLFIETVEEAPRSDEPPAVSATWIEAALRAKGAVPLYAIQFDAGNARFRHGARSVMLQVAHMLLANPLMRVMIVAHTDSSDSFERSVALSSARAEAVMQTLMRNWRVPQSQLTPIGLGFAAPVASNDDKVGRALNQRIELVVQ